MYNLSCRKDVVLYMRNCVLEYCLCASKFADMMASPWKIGHVNFVGKCFRGCMMSRWHHEMENFSALLAICAGNSPVTGEFPAQRPVTQSFDVFLDLRLIKRLSKQWWGWWFETPSRPLWRHSNVNIMLCVPVTLVVTYVTLYTNVISVYPQFQDLTSIWTSNE